MNFLLHLQPVKSLVRNIFFVAVMVLYVVSTMGYGVHKCATNGTASLILLFGESPCEYVHSHVDEHGNTYTHSHAPGKHDQECSHGHHVGCGSAHGGCCGSHNSGEHHEEGYPGHDHELEHDGCCSTDVYVLTQDQNTTVEDNNPFLLQTILIAEMMQDIQAIQAPTVSLSSDRAQLLQPLPHKEGQQALLCTFRI